MVFMRITEDTRELVENFIQDSFGIDKNTPLSSWMEVIAMIDKEADRIVGYCAIEYGGAEIKLNGMYIIEAYRGRGLGSAFVDEIKLLMRENKINQAVYETSVLYDEGENGLRRIEGIIHFFEKQGFWTLRSAEKDDYDNDIRTAIGIMMV